MTMVRLSGRVKEQIKVALIAKKYVNEDLEIDRLTQESETLEVEAKKLAYEACFSKGLRKIMEDAAEGMFPASNSCRIRVEKGSADNYSDETAWFGEPKRVPFRNSHYGGSLFAAVINSDHPYIKAMAAATEKRNELSQRSGQIDEAKYADARRLYRVMDSVTTVKRLVEIWPEVAEYLPEEVSGPQGGLPTEVIDDLNKSFGLK